MTTSHKFDEDYYENGVEKGISGYTNYSYMPTRSYEEAITIKELWGSGKILDFGCAKGYLVHALNQLGFDAYGYDISDYAINNCHPSVVKRVGITPPPFTVDYVVAKDVMEHVPEEEVPIVLKTIRGLCKEALFVIPLGDNNKFRIREYEIDVTHVTKKDEDWWINKLQEAGFKLKDFKYKLGSIKKKWKGYEHGNGFFLVK